jgi:peptidyl-prolyl cis-trans isomerase A (cyclophilin A)
MAGRTFAALVFACLAVVLFAPSAAAQDNPVVVLETSMGAITIELFEEEAPVSVANFLSYVDEGHYDGVIFHRVLQSFMIQGGRFTPSMSPRPTRAPIRNEAANGLDNDRYTVAMARTSEVDSATDQFFINTVDNEFLNHQVGDYGYAVFGRVIDGTDVVDRIESTPVSNAVPNEPVVIESAHQR